MIDCSSRTKSISRQENRRDSGVPADELAATHQTFMQAVEGQHVAVYGVDFSSAPRRAKPIMVAAGQLHIRNRQLRLTQLIRLDSLDAFEQWLARCKTGATGFDLPFGLPRELVCQFGWPKTYEACIETFASYARDELRGMFKAFCSSRPIGGKYAHRATDKPAGSSPSMKWVNPPVAWMLHAGVPRMLASGLTLPGQVSGDPGRVALEAYPGLLARSVSSASYKSDTKARQTASRLQVRRQIVDAVLQGRTRPGVPIQMTAVQRDTLIEDASGDALDAVLCLSQAAWGLSRPEADFGLSPGFDRLEGWIVGAGVA